MCKSYFSSVGALLITIIDHHRVVIGVAAVDRTQYSYYDSSRYLSSSSHGGTFGKMRVQLIPTGTVVTATRE